MKKIIGELRPFKAVINKEVEKVTYDPATLDVKGDPSAEALAQFNEFKVANSSLLQKPREKDNSSLPNDLEVLIDPYEQSTNNNTHLDGFENLSSSENSANYLDDLEELQLPIDMTNFTLPEATEKDIQQNNSYQDKSADLNNLFEAVSPDKFVRDLSRVSNSQTNQSIPPASENLLLEMLGKDDLSRKDPTMYKPKEKKDNVILDVNGDGNYDKSLPLPKIDEKTVISEGPKKLAKKIKPAEPKPADKAITQKGPIEIPNYRINSLTQHLEDIKSAAKFYSDDLAGKGLLKESLNDLYALIASKLLPNANDGKVNPILAEAMKFRLVLEDMIADTSTKPKRIGPYATEEFEFRLKGVVKNEEVSQIIGGYKNLLNEKDRKAKAKSSEKLANWIVKSSYMNHEITSEDKESETYQIKRDQLIKSLKSFGINPAEITAPAKIYSVGEFETSLDGVVQEDKKLSLASQYSLLLIEEDPTKMRDIARRIYRDGAMYAYENSGIFSRGDVYNPLVSHVLSKVDSYLKSKGINDLKVVDAFDKGIRKERKALRCLSVAAERESRRLKIKGGKN